MSIVDCVGIVPPWLGGDVPRAWVDDEYLPVLPVPPDPPDWDVLHYDHGDNNVPDDRGECVIAGVRPWPRDWEYTFGYPRELPRQ